MSALVNPRPHSNDNTLLIEGYASLFGEPDLSGDVVRPGAFARSLRSHAPPAMLLQHKQGAIAGRWTRISEDGRGLYVRGLIQSDMAASAIRGGLDGLSIGFRPRVWQPRVSGGRELGLIDLVEISLVANPMLPSARFTLLGGAMPRAA